MNRPIEVDRYDTSTSGTLLAKRQKLFDVLGRVYQSLLYPVASGMPGTALVSNLWYDPAGNKLKDKPSGSSAWTKFVYDAIGRAIWSYVGYTIGTEDYAEASSLATSIVFEQARTWYDYASNVIEVDSYQRFHNAPRSGSSGEGALNGPASGVSPLARVSFVATYPDGIGRIVKTANYGTNGDTDALSRPAVCPTASSATVLVSGVVYNNRGEPSRR